MTSVLIAGCAGSGVPGAGGAAPLVATAPQSAAFERLLNSLRKQAGLSQVASSSRLDGVAARHAARMQASGVISHRGARGRSIGERVKAAGVTACLTAENVAGGQASAAQAFASWSASAGHRRNMLLPGVTSYGFGRAGNFWTLVLAKPC